MENGRDSSRVALSLCCHPSVKHTALSSSPDSRKTQSDTHSLRNAAWPPPPPPPIAATHEISPTCPSHLHPFATTNKVAFSPQSAACSPFLTPSPVSIGVLLIFNYSLHKVLIIFLTRTFTQTRSVILFHALCLTAQKVKL